jgi:hypothetical protein
MNEILNSLKADLSSRRLLPLVALVAVAFVAAVAYAVLGGGSSAQAPVAAVAPTSTTGVAVSTAPADPTEADSETPSGSRYQRQGGAHDPFLQLPKPAAPKVKVATKTTTASTGGSTPSTGSGTTSTPTTTPAPAPTTPAKPKKPTVEYDVAVLFGAAPLIPGQPPALTPYEKLKRLAPLPSESNPLVVFTGVSASGKGATFVLAREAILKGQATCLPSASQCEMLDLAKGQTEELSYLQANGQTVTYLLQLVSISKREVSPTASARIHQRESRFGRALLRRYAPSVLSDLRFSPLKGVVVYRPQRHHH